MKKIIKFFIIALILGIIIGFGVLAKYTYDNYILPGKVVAHNKINIDNEFTLEFERFIPKRVKLTEEQMKNFKNSHCTPTRQLGLIDSCFNSRTKTEYYFPFAVKFDSQTKKFTKLSLNKLNHKTKKNTNFESCNTIYDFYMSSEIFFTILCHKNQEQSTNCDDSVLKDSNNNYIPGSFKIPRRNFDANETNDGKILIIGGVNCQGNPLDSIEEYDPLTGLLNLKYKMLISRERPISIMLSDDKLLITGGIKQVNNDVELNNNSAEVLDLKTGKSILTNNFFNNQTKTSHYKWIKLDNGNVMLLGQAISIFDSKKFKFFMLNDELPKTDLPLERYDDFKLYNIDMNNVLVTGGNDSAVCSISDPIDYYEIITIKPITNNPPAHNKKQSQATRK